MRNTIFSVVLILNTISCAAIPRPNVYGQKKPANTRSRSFYSSINHANLNLLLGLYAASLINPPKGRYYYPLIVPRYHGLNGLPTLEDIIYEQRLDMRLNDYKRELERIKEDLIYDLRREIERAKEKD